MPLMSHVEARRIGIELPSYLPHLFLYDLAYNRWVWIGPLRPPLALLLAPADARSSPVPSHTHQPHFRWTTCLSLLGHFYNSLIN